MGWNTQDLIFRPAHPKRDPLDIQSLVRRANLNFEISAGKFQKLEIEEMQ